MFRKLFRRSETQRSIGEWADTTFGHAFSAERMAQRAEEEMAELVAAAKNYIWLDNDSRYAIAKEAADVVICLKRMAHTLGFDLDAHVDAKMRINRARRWKRDGTGHGYHI